MATDESGKMRETPESTPTLFFHRGTDLSLKDSETCRGGAELHNFT